MPAAIRQHDVIIISSYEKMGASIKRALGTERYDKIDACKSASSAGRIFLEKSYDIAIINLPLSDQPGVDLAIDISDRYHTGVIVIASAEISEDVAEKVTDHGIILVVKPASSRIVSRATRFMCAMQDKLSGARKKATTLEEKMSEIRIVNRAKWYLIDNKHMSEDDAHKYINKFAMDKCISKGQAAEMILKE